MLEVSDEQLAELQAIERLARRAGACARVLACLRRRARHGANMRAATAKMSWQFRHLNNELMERRAKLNLDGAMRPGGGN